MIGWWQRRAACLRSDQVLNRRAFSPSKGLRRIDMRQIRSILFIALAAVAATGCIYERQVVREESVAPAPPPPAPDMTADSSADQPAPTVAVERDVNDTEVFYERLSPYGYWTETGGYGRVWVPYVGVGWRPYYFGRWVLTDWGWTFVSDDPWGWAGYHYGRWNWGIGVGWYWIPGRIWAPAWVSWRYGGGYAAWCPLGPPGVVFGYSHPAWVAVREEHFTRPISSVAVPLRATAGVVTQAAPLTGPHATVARTGSFGPPVARVQAATGQTIRPVAAASVVGRSARPGAAAPGPRGGPMRSPQPRGSAGDAVQGSPRVRGGAAAPGTRASPPASPRPRGGMGGGWGHVPRASGGGGAAPRSSGGGGYAPHSSGGGGGSAPHSSGGGGGSAPHASGGGGHSSGGHGK
jgi:hypothetical protein